MPIFNYRAVNDQGIQSNGELVAADEGTLKSMLQQDGFWLLESTQSSKIPFKKSNRIKVNRREIIDFFTSFSTMLNAGVPLMEALNSIAKHNSNPDLKYTLERVYRHVESGMSLSHAMAEYPTVFPKQVTTIIAAGEQSGQLPATFAELRKYYEWLAGLISDVKQASTYPIMVFGVVCIFILTLFTFVVPRFTEMLNGMGVALPLVTLLVIDASDFTITYWWLLLSLPIFTFIGLRFLHRKSPRFARKFDAMKLNFPIFGEINRMIALSRFTHNFSMMFRSGIQILDCLKQCQKLVGNAELASIIKETARNVSEGHSMSDTLAKHQAFPPMLIQMVKVGESTGELDYAMTQVSTYYDEEIPRRVKRVFAILEPIIMLSLIGIVGVVAIAIFLPIISLLGGI
ncbi:MAG: type II secretion system F family protein [Ghiorsea sp.]